jgi:hypothetical protein
MTRDIACGWLGGTAFDILDAGMARRVTGYGLRVTGLSIAVPHPTYLQQSQLDAR